MKDIKKRGILLATALVLLIGMAVVFTYAWYTRITSVSALDFHLARWDFNANYQTSSILVNVYEYTHVYHEGGVELAAPGTAGTISLRLGSDNTDVDVDYYLTLDESTISEEFQKRLYFTYYDENGDKTDFDGINNGIVGTVEAHSSAVATIHWEWIYDYDEYLAREDKTQSEVVKILKPIYEDTVLGPMFTADEVINLYNLRSSAIINSSAFKFEAYYEENDSITGNTDPLYSLMKNLTLAERTLFFTIMDNPALVVGGANDPLQTLSGGQIEVEDVTYSDALDLLNKYVFVQNGYTDYQTYYLAYAAKYKAWDEFDTKVGSNPYYYATEMAANICLYGAQILPELVS